MSKPIYKLVDDLFSAMGLTPKEVADVIEKGGFTYE